jgi:hypothetical protein
MNMQGIAVGATVVLSVGASALGTVGTFAELTAKRIDKEKHPILRTIAEVFAKTLQSGPAAFSLAMIGSLLTTNPILLGGILLIGAYMVLTPAVNGIIQLTQNEALKKGMAIADRAVSLSSKLINTAILTVGVALALNIPAAIICGVGLTALNVKAYQK